MYYEQTSSYSDAKPVQAIVTSSDLMLESSYWEQQPALRTIELKSELSYNGAALALLGASTVRIITRRQDYASAFKGWEPTAFKWKSGLVFMK